MAVAITAVNYMLKYLFSAIKCNLVIRDILS